MQLLPSSLLWSAQVKKYLKEHKTWLKLHSSSLK